jgi:signal transduction histidine kinase
MKLRWQLALLVAVAIGASLVTAMILTLKATRSSLEADASKSAEDAAGEIKGVLEKLPPETDEGIEKVLEQSMRKHRRVTGVELVLTDRDVQYSLKTSDQSTKRISPRPHPVQPVVPPAPPMPAVPRSVPRTLTATMGESGNRVFEHRDDISGRIGIGHLTVTVSLKDVDSLIDRQAQVMLQVLAFAVVIASILMVLLADRLVGRPLARLANAMGDVSQGSLDRRVVIRGPPEVKAVTQAFNRMLNRLQEADQAVRSFNERLGAEVHAATSALSDRNAALNHLNGLLVRAREDLAHKERLAVLGQLAAQLAHEVGTPLGSVSGHLQLALASPDCPPSVRDRLVIASQEIARVSRIIRDYLDSTRRIDPEITDVAVDEIIREAVDVARGGNPGRSAGVDIDVAEDAALWRTDAGLIRQILVNIVANALDAVATLKDGETGAVAVRAQVEEGKSRPELVLRVSDNGPGLAPEALSRMFEPFYTTKGRGKGTGLGLAICRELVHSLGGRIDGTSEPGRGTTFTVRVPKGDDIVRRGQYTTTKQLAPVAQGQA